MYLKKSFLLRLNPWESTSMSSRALKIKRVIHPRRQQTLFSSSTVVLMTPGNYNIMDNQSYKGFNCSDAVAPSTARRQNRPQPASSCVNRPGIDGSWRLATRHDASSRASPSTRQRCRATPPINLRTAAACLGSSCPCFCRRSYCCRDWRSRTRRLGRHRDPATTARCIISCSRTRLSRSRNRR